MPPPNPEALRAGLARFIKSRGLTVSGWCKRAGVTEGTLRSFLAGRSQTLTHATLAALAYAAEEPITALVRGNSVWGKTEAIEVKFQVAATEREGNAHRFYRTNRPFIFDCRRAPSRRARLAR